MKKYIPTVSNSQRGFIAFSTVLIIMVVSLAVASTVGYLAIGEAQSSLTLFKGEDTLQFVEGCMEDALVKIRSDSTIAVGSFTISRPEGICTITIVSKVGTVWTIRAAVTPPSTQYQRTVQVVINRAVGGITITSWKEI